MKSLLVIMCVLLQGVLLAQVETEYSQSSIFLKLKLEHNQMDRSISEKFDIPILADVKAKFPVKEIKLSGNRKLKNTYVVYFEQDENVLEAVAQYQQSGMFEYVALNQGGVAGGQKFETFDTTPSDALFSRQWGMKNDGTFSLSPAVAGADIKMEQAWDIETGDPDILIAVLDSGARINHPELAGRLWTNTDEVMDGTDTDGNGYIDDVQGWNFAYSDNDPTDDVGHGTNIIGVIASNSDNAIAYAGINWNSKVMNVKMLDSNNSYTDGAWAVDAIYYAVDNGANVINMSWGGGAFPPLEDAIEYAHSQGVVLVAAMLNFDNDVAYYPAAYDQTIAVGSIDPDGERSSPFYWSQSSGSNYGSHIDLIAPGNYTYNITNTSDTNYNIYWGGTSQATPHVVGVASLLLSKDPSLSPDDVRTILRDSADDQTGDPAEDIAGFDIYYGYGRLNAFSALDSSLSIEDATSDVDIAIFPNPTSGDNMVTIAASSKPMSQIVVHNVLGGVVDTITFENGRTDTKLNTSQYAKGMYMLSITFEATDLTINKKLVVE